MEICLCSSLTSQDQKSISASGHKFGLAPLGCGFVVWRDVNDLPDDLIFHVNYLGGDMSVFQLNFSRPAGPIIAQYYQLLRLGFDGYKKVHMNCYKTAQYLAKEIEKLGIFEIIFDGNPNKGIPAVTWRLKEDAEVSFNLYDFADKLRSRGWLVPAYSLPKYADNVVVQRILVRQGFGLDMASLLMQDIKRTLKYFETHRVVSHSLPKYADNVVVQRILVRQGFGLDMASLLMQDIKRTLKYFETHRVVSHLNEEDVASLVVQRILVRQGFGLDMASLLMQDIKRTLKYFETHRVVSHLNEEDVASLNHTGR